MYVDYAYAGKVATCGVMLICLMSWIGKKLVEFAYECDLQGQALKRDMDHMPPVEQDEQTGRVA
jgi:hypothetical protein